MNESVRFKKELLVREYGSNVVKIVDEIAKNSNKTERTNQAKLLIKLIEKMNPSIRYADNYEEILWGHLYILSDLQLDVDIDYKKPIVEFTKPQKVNYPNAIPKYKHYGKNIEILGNELAKLTDEEDKKEASISFGKLLKTLYSNWNTNSVGDKLIAYNVEELSHKNLKVESELISDDTKDSPFYTKRRSNPSNVNRNSNNRSKNTHRNNSGRTNNNRKRIDK